MKRNDEHDGAARAHGWCSQLSTGAHIFEGDECLSYVSTPTMTQLFTTIIKNNIYIALFI